MRFTVSHVLALGFLLLLTSGLAAGQSQPANSAAKLLPDRLAEFTAAGTAIPHKLENDPDTLFGVTSAASRAYLSKDGQRIWQTLMLTSSNATAYALLTKVRYSAQTAGQTAIRADVGTEGFQLGGRLFFAQGAAVVTVDPDDRSRGGQGLVSFAKAFASTLDAGERDIPVLIKHLPNWESVYERVLYSVDKNSLINAIGNQPVLEALSFHGGAEAAVADYNGAKMVLVEFNTPQIATDNDQRISAKLQELRNQGQALPAYRRVGNYAVFVFDAPNQEAANALIDQVKYQPMVQWLGENPYRYDEAVREFTETTLGVFVNVVKASGLVILGSLAVGGFLGALLFTRRRKQQRAQDAYSDAGGMLRLNLDEITPPTNSARLLGPGN